MVRNVKIEKSLSLHSNSWEWRGHFNWATDSGFSIHIGTMNIVINFREFSIILRFDQFVSFFNLCAFLHEMKITSIYLKFEGLRITSSCSSKSFTFIELTFQMNNNCMSQLHKMWWSVRFGSIITDIETKQSNSSTNNFRMECGKRTTHTHTHIG